MLLEILVGALLTVLSYPSLAIVLPTATLAASQHGAAAVALGLVLGANVGSGVLAWLAANRCPPQARRLPLGNLLFKVAGALIAIPLLALALYPLSAATRGRSAPAGGLVPPRIQRAAPRQLFLTFTRA